MKEHHRASLENLIREIAPDERFLAVILGGSIAHGTARDNSDVDVYLVVTDEYFAERMACGDTSFVRYDLCPYPGGYIDGKIVNLGFLEAAAAHGSEPTRASFEGSFAPWSRIEGLDTLIERIRTVGESDRQSKMDAFYAQVDLWSGYFYRKAIEKGDPYLKHRAVVETVFFAARYVLAENGVLFPCHKDLFSRLEKCARMPENFLQNARELLERPDGERLSQFHQAFLRFSGPRLSEGESLSRFIHDSEWNWLDAPPPVSDC